jgi:hypothetical protein
MLLADANSMTVPSRDRKTLSDLQEDINQFGQGPMLNLYDF